MSSRLSFDRRTIITSIATALAIVAVAAFAIFALNSTPKADATERTPVPQTTIGKPFIPHLLVIGDSFTGGSKEGGTEEKGWAALIQSGYTNDGARLQLNLLGRGGAGYVTKGQIDETFIESYKGNAHKSQQVMVVFGGLNDTEKPADKVGAAASALYAEMRSLSPDAPLIVVGPAWPNSEPVPNIYLVRDAIKAAALGAGATFIDPIEQGWFSGEREAMIGLDGTHPTDDGHKYMADQIAPTVLAAVKTAVEKEAAAKS